MISPVIFEIGPVSLRWYGVLTALGGVAGYMLMSRRCKNTPVKQEQLGDLVFAIIVSAIIGARLFYVTRFWNESFANRPFSAVFKIWEGGLVFQGGFIVSAIAVCAICALKKIPVWSVGDLVAPALPLGHAIGRIGCFINGCCYGFAPYDGPLAVHYPFSSQGHFPAQLVESAGNLLICAMLLALERFRIAKNKRFIVYLMAYTVLRFCVEPLRGDYPLDQVWCRMTPGQYHALWQLPLFILAYLAVAWHEKRQTNRQAQHPEKKA